MTRIEVFPMLTALHPLSRTSLGNSHRHVGTRPQGHQPKKSPSWHIFTDVFIMSGWKELLPEDSPLWRKSFTTLLSSSDNCFFPKQSLPPEWVPGDGFLDRQWIQHQVFLHMKHQCRSYLLKFLKCLCLFLRIINKLIWKQALPTSFIWETSNAAKDMTRRDKLLSSLTERNTSS